MLVLVLSWCANARVWIVERTLKRSSGVGVEQRAANFFIIGIVSRGCVVLLLLLDVNLELLRYHQRTYAGWVLHVVHLVPAPVASTGSLVGHSLISVSVQLKMLDRDQVMAGC